MRTTVHPFGVPLEVRAAEPRLHDLVRDAVSGWEGAADRAAPRLRMHVGLADSLHGTGPAEVRAGHERLRLTGPGVRCRASSVTRRAVCILSRDWLADGERLRGDVLDPVMLFLLTRNGRAPIHAAGIMAGDRPIVLAGPSGIGKSCLAQAALDAGFCILSDDTVYVEPAPSERVWGVPRPVRLLAGDAPAAAGEPAPQHNGKLKCVVPIRAGGHAAVGRAPILCLLSPGSRASLSKVGRDEAMQAFERLDAGFDLVAKDVRAAVSAIAHRGAWRLSLSGDPADAIRVLRANLPRLTEQGR